MIVHKNSPPPAPRLSFILLDWSCREQLNVLKWLDRQDIPRDQYELIWVELYDRVNAEVMENADVVITCNQSGMYHKHLGYNAGLLQAKGDLICVCDSDAVFPPDFVNSVFNTFNITDNHSDTPLPLVLMHYEWRTSFLYPEDLDNTETLKDAEKWKWWPLIVNEGACMTVRRADAINFGGFDEHKSFLGYMCGPYDLGWRLINAGWPEIWHDESVALWHFAHPDPVGTNGHRPSLKQLLEKAYPHIHGHALSAVEAFSTGRFQPLQENEEIWNIRMAKRQIGSELERRYARMTGRSGYSKLQRLLMWKSLYFEIINRYLGGRLAQPIRRIAPKILGDSLYSKLKSVYRDYIGIYKIKHTTQAESPVLLCTYKGHNIIKIKDSFYAARHTIGALDLSTDEGRSHPELLKSECFKSLIKVVRRAHNN